MIDSELISAVEKSREPAQHWFAHFEQQQRLGVWLQPPKLDTPTLAEPIQKLLKARSEYKTDKFVSFGNKQVQTMAYGQAVNLLRVATQRGPKDAVEWLRKVTSLQAADLRVVAEIYGLSTENEVTLSNGVHFVPLASLAPSANSKAILAQFEVRRVCYIPIRALHRSQLSTNYQTCQRAKTVSLPPKTQATIPRWITMPMSEGQMWKIVPVSIDNEAVDWVEKHLLLKANVRRRCDVALDRLNLARHRVSPGNKAIEGCICLEALLSDADEKTEISYRLRLRSALLLISKIEERQEIRKDVGALRTLRSKTVHGVSRPCEAQRRYGLCKQRNGHLRKNFANDR